MAVTPSADLPTTPNAPPVAAGHLGGGSEAAAASNSTVSAIHVTAELVQLGGMEEHQPSADNPSATTHPTHHPTHPNQHPIVATHLGGVVEAAAAADGAILPSDTSADVATTFPPPSPQK